uniref:Serine/threonine-protein kinase receptor n=2 Tax=Caenorhabditis tropicalis TaxID=1561998 RepID=A0A1I7TIX0_9PELO
MELNVTGLILDKSLVDRVEKKLLKSFLDKYMKNRNHTFTHQELEEQLTLISGSNPPTEGPEEIGAPLECAFYNSDDCEATGKCEITKETCYPESHLKGAGCYAVFSFPPVIEKNSTDLYIPVHRSQYQKLGCIQFQDPEMMGCAHDSICRQSQTVRTVGHCCCGTPNCNGQGLEQLNPAMMSKGGVPMYGIFSTLLIVIFLLACFVIALFGYRYNKQKEELKRKKFDKEKTNAMENGNLPLVAPEPTETTSIEMVEKPKALPISDFLLISKGRFGCVYKAKWTENGEEKQVAVKKVCESQKASFEAEKSLFDFFQTLDTRYSAIVGYVCAEQVGNEYWIVTDFQERLSLFELLKHNEISLTACGRLLLSMLDGLQFLHDDRPFFVGYLKKPVIHRDIKSKNILVKRDMTACIADFGLARAYDFATVRRDLTAQVGTRRYMAPETMDGAVEFTAAGFKAMDVYSMALVMWETISRTKLSETDTVPEYQVPYAELKYDPKLNKIREHVVTKQKRPLWRPEIKENESTQKFSSVAEQMWEKEGAARITAGCAFYLIWNQVMKGVTFPEESAKWDMEQGLEEEYNFQMDPAGTERMSKYHADYSLPHPSPDPINDQCPPVPPIPIVTENGTTYPNSTPNEPQAEPQESQIEECAEEENPKEERFFSMITGEFVTREQRDALNEADSFNGSATGNSFS